MEFHKCTTGKLCNFLTEKFNITFNFDNYLDDSILGKVNYKNRQISIDKDLTENTSKWRFTLAHEIGHFFLHQKYSDQLSEIKDKDIDVENINDRNLNARMEIQSNIFASQLLMPKNSVRLLAINYFTEERIYKGYLFLDHQSRNQITVMKFLSILEKYFKVSKSVAKYRLISLGLLKEDTEDSIKSIMKRL